QCATSSLFLYYFFSSRRRHTRFSRDWSSDVCSSDLRNINAVLHDDARDPVSGSVPLRAIVCDIRRDGVASRGVWSGQRRFVVGRSEERRVGKECGALGGAIEEGMSRGGGATDMRARV